MELCDDSNRKSAINYMQMKFGVLVFPGSNCDHDTYHVISEALGEPVVFLWHESETLENCDAILVPGGFAYGDYLRTGAIAHFAPIMQAVRSLPRPAVWCWGFAMDSRS